MERDCQDYPKQRTRIYIYLTTIILPPVLYAAVDDTEKLIGGNRSTHTG